MARKKDTPCAECGTLVWRGTVRCGACVRGELKHGTRLMYRERKCRCQECRAWAAAETRSYNARRKALTGESYWQSRKRVPKRTFAGNCGGCGKALAARVENPMCSKCRGDQPGRNIKISPTERRAIYDRDEWICQLCTEPVDPMAPVNSRWDATLDHIVPASLGGDDSPENLRLAHRRCNAVRGARFDAKRVA